MKKFRSLIISTAIGLLLIVAGFGLLVAIMHSRESHLVITPPAHFIAVPAHRGESYISGPPLSIAIPSLHMNLSIVPGSYDAHTQTWTLTIDKVQYATITPPPNNQGGNTFLYGHYRSNVFARLHDIQSGAQAVIKTSNGHSFYYQLSAVRVVSPADSKSVFAYQGKPILTVQTCTGLFFQNRQLFIFSLVKAV